MQYSIPLSHSKIEFCGVQKQKGKLVFSKSGVFHTSKFYPSRRSSKMIAKNEPLELISEAALHLPTKFGEDWPKDLGEVGEQTEKKQI